MKIGVSKWHTNHNLDLRGSGIRFDKPGMDWAVYFRWGVCEELWWTITDDVYLEERAVTGRRLKVRCSGVEKASFLVGNDC